MEEMIEIIKKMQEIKISNEELIENQIFRKGQEVEKKEYINDREGELLQELAETKDIYTRKRLIEEINKIRDEKAGKLSELNQKLEEKLSEAKKKIESREYMADKIEALKEDMKAKQLELEENIQKTKLMKNNRDMLKDKDGNVRESAKEAYERLTRDLRPEVKTSRRLRAEIQDMNQTIADFEKGENEYKTLKQFVEDIENKRFDKILAKVSENDKVKQEENLAWEEKEKAEAQEEIEEWEKQENDKPNSTATPGLFSGLFGAKYYISEVVIKPNKIKTIRENGEIEIDNDEAEPILEQLGKETQDRIETMKKNGIKYDVALIKALLTDEEQLNQYLDICVEYYEGIKKDSIMQYKLPENFPKIQYDLRTLRKNDELSEEAKLELYRQAKATNKMFKTMKIKDCMKINMNIVDKVYYSMKDFMETRKNSKREAIPETTSARELIDFETTEGLDNKTWVLTPEQKRFIAETRIEAKKARAKQDKEKEK